MIVAVGDVERKRCLGVVDSDLIRGVYTSRLDLVGPVAREGGLPENPRRCRGVVGVKKDAVVGSIGSKEIALRVDRESGHTSKNRGRRFWKCAIIGRVGC